MAREKAHLMCPYFIEWLLQKSGIIQTAAAAAQAFKSIVRSAAAGGRSLTAEVH